jgi:hypothetical protein
MQGTVIIILCISVDGLGRAEKLDAFQRCPAET